MKKLWVLLISFVLMLFLIIGCAKTSNEITVGKAAAQIKTAACEKADETGGCFTKLPELNIISPEECCKQMGKCCSGK